MGKNYRQRPPKGNGSSKGGEIFEAFMATAGDTLAEDLCLQEAFGRYVSKLEAEANREVLLQAIERDPEPGRGGKACVPKADE